MCACLNIFKHWTWCKQIWKTILKIVDDFICNIYVRKMWLPFKISYKKKMYFKAKNQIFVILSLLQNQPKMLWQQNCWLIRSKAKAVINAFVCQTSLSRRIRCIIMKLQYDSIQLLNMRPDTWLSVDKTCNNCCMCATDFLKIKTRKHTF